MTYKTITLWIDRGVTWIAYSADNGRDLAMSTLKPWEVGNSIAWAQSHNLHIIDNRQAA